MAKSIKLGSDTYLDSTGVTINNSGKTLATKIAERDGGVLALSTQVVNSESDINSVVQGTAVISCTTNVSIGGIKIPAFSRMIKINYASSDCAILGVTPSHQIIVLFRNNSTWSGKLV